jgi:2-phospho-L-lactate guanylyltransferase
VNYVLLPVKAPAQAKARLAPLLSAAERQQLARLMFARALDVLMAARGFDRVVVVSSDEETLGQAEQAGALALWESSQQGHSASAEWAAEWCMADGARTLLMVPIDAPLMRPADIEMLWEAAGAMPRPALIIVPSADGTGTNALLRTPPNVIRSAFGPDSFSTHVSRAQAGRVPVRVERPAGLVFDLDTPADVADFLAPAPDGAIADFLRACPGIMGRR